MVERGVKEATMAGQWFHRDRWLRPRFLSIRVLLAVACLLASIGVNHVSAQVTSSIAPDGTMGTTVTQAGILYTIDGGTIDGGNQFHPYAC